MFKEGDILVWVELKNPYRELQVFWQHDDEYSLVYSANTPLGHESSWMIRTKSSALWYAEGRHILTEITR